MNKTNQQSPLQPLIDHAKENRGTIVQVIKLMKEETGKKFHRQQVTSWLEADRKARVEPRISIGLALLRIQQEIVGKQFKL